MDGKTNKILLLGLIIWVVGDLVTTYIGFNRGIPEANPFLIGKSIYSIAGLKIIGAIILYLIIKILDSMQTKNESVNRFIKKFISKYPFGILLYGSLITIFNLFIIFVLFEG